MQTIDKSIYTKKDKRPSIETAKSVEKHGLCFNLLLKKSAKESKLVSINKDLEIDSHRIFSSYQNVIFRKSVDKVSLAYQHLKRKSSQDNLIAAPKHTMDIFHKPFTLNEYSTMHSARHGVRSNQRQDS